MNRGTRNHNRAKRIDHVEGRNAEKQKILPRSIHKKEKTRSKKIKVEFEKTAALLHTEKIKNDEGNEKSDLKDHTAIPIEDETPAEESRPKFFGVRNYLHNFYEAVSIKNPQIYEDIPDESEVNDQANKESILCKYCWRIGIAVGLTIMIIGLILVLVGFITPMHPSIAEQNDDYLIIDRNATAFNYYMKVCRLVGVGMFISGLSLFLAIILLALCWNVDDGRSYSDEENSEPICLNLNSENTYQKAPEKEIPSTEKLNTAQPKQVKEDIVMTKTGLCVPPNITDNKTQ